MKWLTLRVEVPPLLVSLLPRDSGKREDLDGTFLPCPVYWQLQAKVFPLIPHARLAYAALIWLLLISHDHLSQLQRLIL